MSVMNHIPTIFYNTIPDGLDTMDPPATINQVKANIKEYGKILDRDSSIPLD